MGTMKYTFLKAAAARQAPCGNCHREIDPQYLYDRRENRRDPVGEQVWLCFHCADALPEANTGRRVRIV